MPVATSRTLADGLYVILIVFLAALGPLQFGFHIAELNAPQDVITCKQKPAAGLVSTITRMFSGAQDTASNSLLPPCIPMTDSAFASISSIFTLGGLCGALAAGPVTSAIGRRPAMQLTGFCFLLGSLLETFAGSITPMFLGRLIGGVGAGASTVIVPLYVSEVAPPERRGLFGTSTQVMINVGILITQCEGYVLSYGSAWRWILASGITLSTLHLVGLVMIPESPTWLASQGKYRTARQFLTRIRGPNVDITEEVSGWKTYDVNPSAVATEEDGLLASPPMSSSSSTSAPTHLGFLDVLYDADAMKGIIACVGIATGQQLCGINSIIMYSVSLLNDLLPISSAALTIIISLVNLGTTLACSPLPDRLGRRTCLLLSIAGQGTSSFILAYAIQNGLKYLSALAVLSFVGCFAVGLGPVPFIMASELVNPEAVGAAQSWTLGANYIATFLIAQFFPIANNLLNEKFGGQGWIYYGFAAMAMGVYGFVWSVVPETKGKRNADEVWGRTRRID